VRRDVLDQGAAGRRRRRDRRHLPRARVEARQGLRGMGLGELRMVPGKPGAQPPAGAKS
jgi:hypothetical protein